MADDPISPPEYRDFEVRVIPFASPAVRRGAWWQTTWAVSVANSVGSDVDLLPVPPPELELGEAVVALIASGTNEISVRVLVRDQVIPGDVLAYVGLLVLAIHRGHGPATIDGIVDHPLLGICGLPES